MDEFIVRIYHQNDSLQSSNEIFGVVERIGQERRRTFRSMHELWELLCTPTGVGRDPEASSGH